MQLLLVGKFLAGADVCLSLFFFSVLFHFAFFFPLRHGHGQGMHRG